MRLPSTFPTFLLAATAFAPDALAQEAPVPEQTAAVAASSELASADSVPRDGPADPAELEAWLDGYLGSYMDDEHIAGATVSVVRNGQVLLSKGYGYADLEEQKPVDPATTLFRIGSISKLFVWTSVMQLAERDLLQLDVDVNTYLEGVEVPATYDEPVTLEDIMSHSAGFEDHVIGLFGNEAADVRPLGELLVEQMPDRIRPPGVISSYSNHATGLAMLIVEQVSGVPWEQYIDDNIIGPLGMSYATFGQPVPDRLADDLSVGYGWGGGQFVPKEFEWVPLGPVGAASVSADDMARFMVAHLNLGQGDNARILSESSALDMQSVLLRQAPGVNAMLHGFAEYSRNGRFAYGHGGDTSEFHSLMVLLPDHEVGIFASFNTETASPGQLINAFFDRYYPPEEAAPITAPANFAGRVDAYTGSYRAARYSHTDVTKLAVLAGVLEVTDSGDGALLTSLRPGVRFIEVQPGLFREENGHETLAFRSADGEPATYMFLEDLPYIGFERVPTLEAVGLHIVLLVGGGVLFLLTALLWPLTGFYRMRFGVDVPEGRIPGFGRLLLWLPSVAFLVFVGALAVILGDPFELALGNTGPISVALWLPVVGGLVAVAALVYGIGLWLTHTGTVVGRVSYALVTLAFMSFLWQLNTFNLLGWKL